MSLRFVFPFCAALLVLSQALLPSVGLAASDERLTAHLRSRVVAAETSAQPGRMLTLGLLFEHDEHWHTYWRNPGDSGLKTEVELSLPAGAQFHGIDWPAPERFVLSEEIINFGYSGRTVLPMRVSVPADFTGEKLAIAIKARWLICEHECIPGKADYTLSLPVQRSGIPEIDKRWVNDFSRSSTRQPQAAAITAVLKNDATGLVLTLSGVGVPSDLTAWTLYPVVEELMTYGSPPQWQQRAGQWQTALRRSDYFTQLPTNSAWVLVKGDRALAFTARGEINDAFAGAEARN